MGFDKECSFVMAKRIKQLREEKGLSHDRLSKALSDKYGINISPDSLMNYEVSDKNHTKAYKNLGMRVEYLRCLADFFEVSADYLLGTSDIRSVDPNIKMITELTGISEQCARALVLADKANREIYVKNPLLIPSDLRYEIYKLLEETGILQIITQEKTAEKAIYSKYSRTYDEVIFYNIAFLSRYTDEMIKAFLSDEDTLKAYRKTVETFEYFPNGHAQTPPDGFTNDLKAMLEKGYTCIFPDEYIRFGIIAVAKAIEDYLRRKYLPGNLQVNNSFTDSSTQRVADGND